MITAMENPLAQEVALGITVEAFLASGIGRYLIARWEAEIEEAVERLKHVDPEDPKAIRELQAQVYRAESLQYWLAEAIQAGISAEDELNEGRP